jgi:hypothetical protein
MDKEFHLRRSTFSAQISTRIEKIPPQKKHICRQISKRILKNSTSEEAHLPHSSSFDEL